MPFTPSHAVLFLIAKKCNIRTSATAFITGTMVPDFESFLLMRNTDKLSHTWKGIFLIDIPLALVLCFLFHQYVKDTLFSLLPAYYKKRLYQPRQLHWPSYFSKNTALVLLSTFVGAISHLVWDDFTHEAGYASYFFPVLDEHIEWLNFTPIFFVVQVASSIVGLLLLQLYISQMPCKPVHINPVKRKKERFIFITVATLTVMIFLLRYVLMPRYNHTSDLIKAFLGAGLYAMLLVSIFRQKLLKLLIAHYE